MKMGEVVMETPTTYEGVGFFEKVKKVFHREEVEGKPVYHRRLWDGRIERYLDENFNDYIAEYELVTKTDIAHYEGRYKLMGKKLRELDTFTLDVDAKVTDLERRIAKLGGKKR
jgi:hypothetical protein